MRILIGGSPCTFWSIAQTKNRETEASGMGWELLKNYVISRDKFKPDYFLYENNKSMSPKIREKITAMFGVEPVLINSALVSAQNRQRLYWVGKRNADGTYSKVDVEQPEDRGILLRDVVETTAAEKGYALAEPLITTPDGKSFCITATEYKGSNAQQTLTKHRRTMVAEQVRIGTIESDTKDGAWDSRQYRVNDQRIQIYEVRDSRITIKGKQYQIRLADGFYIIRKLTVTECKRLQTVPDSYEFPVSNSQAYKMLGNGWTVEVIMHLMRHFDGITTETIDVLSMYDGMACGHIALDKLGANINRYYATEIDKYAVKTATHNFPDIIELGDAFQVRKNNWRITPMANDGYRAWHESQIF